MLLEQDAIEDVLDLNEKFLCAALGIDDPLELATLPKIELRVDTADHCL